MLVDYLNVSIHGYACELFVNGAPILRTSAAAPYTATPTVSEWLVDGDNEIAVRVDEVAPPAATSDPLSPRRLIVQRCEGPLGAIVPAGQDLVRDELVYTPQATSAPLPLHLAYGFRLPASQRWAWESAPVLALDAATVAELHLFLEALHADLCDGDIDGVLARQRIKFAEVAPRYGSEVTAAREGMKQHFARLAADGAWSVAPLRLADLDLRLCCGGRVIEPRTRDGRPALRGTGAGVAGWRLPIFIARLGGVWEVVR